MTAPPRRPWLPSSIGVFSPERRPLLLWGVFIAVLTFVVFSPLLSAGFINWDDPLLILDNPHFRGFSPDRLRWMFTTTYLCHYEPLPWLSWALDFKI